MKYRNLREMPFVPVGTEWVLIEVLKKFYPSEAIRISGPSHGFEDSEMEDLVKQGWMERAEERRWPKRGDVYFTLGLEEEIVERAWFDSVLDNLIYAQGYLFWKREHAKSASEAVKEVLKKKREEFYGL